MVDGIWGFCVLEASGRAAATVLQTSEEWIPDKAGGFNGAR